MFLVFVFLPIIKGEKREKGKVKIESRHDQLSANQKRVIDGKVGEALHHTSAERDRLF